MIYAKDKGQMCNNLLQFAHVYAWARTRGRRAISMRLTYKYPFFRVGRTRGHNWLRYLWGKYAPKLGLLRVVDFDASGADPKQLEAMMEAHANIRVDGWKARFYDDFLRHKPEIIALLDFLPQVRREATRILAPTAGRVRIGLHVRRGDYARWMQGRFFYSHEQYAALLGRVLPALAQGREACVYITTNDAELPLDLYKQAVPQADVRLVGSNPGVDLCVLSECDWIIGAPSTFSLVAALYHDAPLYWIKDPQATPTRQDFSTFDYLFRHII